MRSVKLLLRMTGTRLKWFIQKKKVSEPIHTKATTIGGTLFVLLANINSADIVKTIILTAIGAVVSFGMSVLLKFLLKWWKTRRG